MRYFKYSTCTYYSIQVLILFWYFCKVINKELFKAKSVPTSNNKLVKQQLRKSSKPLISISCISPTLIQFHYKVKDDV